MRLGHAHPGAVFGAAGIGVTAVLLAVAQTPVPPVPDEIWHLIIGAFGLPGVLASGMVILVALKQLRAPPRPSMAHVELAAQIATQVAAVLEEHRDALKVDMNDALTKAYLAHDLKETQDKLAEARRLLRDSAG